MLDVPELEKQWSRYHFKKMLPRYIGGVFILALFSIGGFFANEHKDELLVLLNQIPKLEKKVAKVQTTTDVTSIPEKQVLEVVYVQDILYPSYTFLEPLELAYINYNNAQKLAFLAAEKKKILKKRKPKVKPKKKVKKVSRPVKRPVLKPKVKQAITTPTKRVKQSVAVVSTPSPQILIKGSEAQPPKVEVPSQAIIKVGSTRTSEDEIRSIIKRFNRKKKPALSLFIAKKYYELGNFEGAYKYANETYKLNKNIEAATIIYAKAAVKLSKKENALNRLDKYIKKNSSHKARKLRDDIQKGTF